MHKKSTAKTFVALSEYLLLWRICMTFNTQLMPKYISMQDINQMKYFIRSKKSRLSKRPEISISHENKVTRLFYTTFPAINKPSCSNPDAA